MPLPINFTSRRTPLISQVTSFKLLLVFALLMDSVNVPDVVVTVYVVHNVFHQTNVRNNPALPKFSLYLTVHLPALLVAHMHLSALD
jgi:glycogen synthase